MLIRNVPITSTAY